MEKNKFYEEMKVKVYEAFPEGIRDEMQIELKEVTKNNDVKLHGLTIGIKSDNVAPTFYLEESFKAFNKGMPIEVIAKGILEAYTNALGDKPEMEDLPLAFEDIKDKLVVRPLDAECNRERLKALLYKPIGNSMVMIAYIVLKENPEGTMCFAVTKDMAKEQNYDVDRLFDIALANTRERYEPSLTEMSTMLFSPSGKEITNPFEEGFQINLNENILVLTNKENNLGAITLFYPDMQKRIGELINNNYYVIPSSIHEVLIVPENSDPGLAQLQSMVKEVNATVVDSKEVLSNRIFMYDREKDRLFEPEERAKADKEMEVR